MKIIGAAIIILATHIALAGEMSSLNLRVPAGLVSKELVFGIHHRFLGRVDDDPLGTHLGLDLGANVSASMRYRLWAALELNASYIRSKKEYTAGAGYALPIPGMVRSEIALEYFDYEEPAMTERRRNLFYQLLLQTKPLLDHISVTADAAYDGYNLRFGSGFGVDCGFALDLGPVERVHIIGEYYPVFAGDTTVTGPENSFAAGIKLGTYGHHFTLFVGNNTSIGMRRLMLGAPANYLYFGFNVLRFLKF